ncbi:MAG: ribosome-associated translation inhibitor RaiA [Gemmatimonadetes bacterium]|nr:ribosome-associated translation inhibitor RaiA [Gemmatimonadota bacterium]
MKVSVTARHFDLTPQEREHTEERIQRFSKYERGLLNAHVVLEQQRSRKIAEIMVHARHGDFTAKAESHDLLASIDGACEKMETQIRRSAEKLRDHHVNGNGKEAVGLGETRIESERRNREMMSLEEATNRVEDGEELVVFADTDSGATRVVYRRPDGSVKLIEVAD